MSNSPKSEFAPNQLLREIHSRSRRTPGQLPRLNIRKIISGGQTGADRAGLDFGLANYIPIGGWCPKGRRAEDGIVPTRYPLLEHPQYSYQPRTIQNIQEADFTVIFARAPLSPGSQLTLNQCQRLGKRHVWLHDFPNAEADANLLRVALQRFDGVLNVAGSRESKCPGIHQHVLQVLQLAIAQPRTPTEQELN